VKPFNLEKALAGAPCVTRSGHEARVVFYDPTEKGETTVLAVIKRSDTTKIWDSIWVRINGKNYRINESIDDLFMAEELEKIDLSTAKMGDRFELADGNIVTFTGTRSFVGNYVCIDSNGQESSHNKDGKIWCHVQRPQWSIVKKLTPQKPEIDLSTAKFGDEYINKEGRILVFIKKIERSSCDTPYLFMGLLGDDTDPYSFTKDGKFYYGKEHSYDLVEKLLSEDLYKINESDKKESLIFNDSPSLPTSKLVPCSKCGIYPQRFSTQSGGMFFECNSCYKDSGEYKDIKTVRESWNDVNTDK
jgi:hypothetical protein